MTRHDLFDIIQPVGVTQSTDNNVNVSSSLPIAGPLQKTAVPIGCKSIDSEEVDT